jgi:hypothetical protein
MHFLPHNKNYNKSFDGTELNNPCRPVHLKKQLRRKFQMQKKNEKEYTQQKIKLPVP